MTFGSFAENYEFAAMKSSGISLQRAMKMLTITIGILAFVSFFFANNVIPDAQFRFINLRKNIVQQRPAMAIAEGQFNTIGSSNIKVDKKSGDNGEFLEGVTMHVKNNNMGLGANTIIKAKRGVLTSEDDSNYLQLELYDGYYYEDIHPKKFEERKRLPFAKSSFQKYVVNIDLTKLNQAEMDDGSVTSEKMLTVPELKYTIDSLQRNYNKDVISYAENVVVRNDNVFHKKKGMVVINNTPQQSKVVGDAKKDLLSIFTPIERKQILEMAKSNAASTEFTIQSSKLDLEDKTKNINNHWLAIHEKFVIAYSCLLMFFIGAPLGAIIRKGGLGLPMVFAILIFITFHFINTFGRKVAQQDSIPPFLGAWMSSILMTPFAVLLTYRATNDIGLMINFDWLTDPIMKLFTKKEDVELKFKREIVSLDTVIINLEDSEYAKLNALDSTTIKGIVKNAEQFGYTTEYRLKALKILESRGITQDELLVSNSLFNSDYLKLEYYYNAYKKQSGIALVFHLLSFVLTVLASTGKPLFIILGILNLIFMYVTIFKSSECLEEIKTITHRESFTNLYVALLLGFPFYIFIYSYNRIQLKEAVAEFNE
jgi:lipopolysaccharide export system permease protein